MIRIYVDKQGNWQTYADWQDAIVEGNPEQFAFHEVDKLPDVPSRFINGEFVAIEDVDDDEEVDIPAIDPIAVWEFIADQGEAMAALQSEMEELKNGESN